MNASTASISVRNERRRNSALWLGFILVILSLLSQGLFFVRVPGQGLIPWLSLGLAAAGVVLLSVGMKRAFSQAQLYRGKVAGSIIAVISALLLAVSVFAFVTARKLPGAAGVPQVGQKAPDFTLVDTNGQEISLAHLLATPVASGHPQAVLLVFYRGYWWPFCNLELRGIQKDLKQFEDGGVVPVAISVDPPDVSRDLAKKAGYTFTILSDPQLDAIRRYHLVHAGGGPEGHDIARPAEFLVDSTGTVRWTNFTEDIRVRARADEMMKAARSALGTSPSRTLP
jgi:peroxiredoxin